MPKFYAVAAGYRPGIYTNWAICNEQVSGFEHCKFKRFDTREEAQNFLDEHRASLQQAPPPAQAAPQQPSQQQHQHPTQPQLTTTTTTTAGQGAAIQPQPTELATLGAAKRETARKKIKVQEEITEKENKVLSLDAKYATKFQQGLSTSQSKEEFDSYSTLHLQPLSNKISQIKIEIQDFSALKSQFQDEEDAYGLQIDAKRAEIVAKTLAAEKPQITNAKDDQIVELDPDEDRKDGTKAAATE